MFDAPIPPAPNDLDRFEFLKRRFAMAVERGDDDTAARLRLEIARLFRGHPLYLAIRGAVT